jgi:Protein of unknown function (DUF2934)
MSRQKTKSKTDPVLPDQSGHSMRIDPQNDELERIEEVRQRAHQLHEARGGQRGHVVDDWLADEAQIAQSSSRHPK